MNVYDSINQRWNITSNEGGSVERKWIQSMQVAHCHNPTIDMACNVPKKHDHKMILEAQHMAKAFPCLVLLHGLVIPQHGLIKGIPNFNQKEDQRWASS